MPVETATDLPLFPAVECHSANGFTTEFCRSRLDYTEASISEWPETAHEATTEPGRDLNFREYVEESMINSDGFVPKEHVSATDRLRPSSYNYFIDGADGTKIGYNFLYKSVIRFPALLFSELKQLLREFHESITPAETTVPESPEKRRWIEKLRDARFLIDGSIDELSLIKFRYFRGLYASDALSLIILPTLKCNFNCPYCFEQKKDLRMNADIQEALLNWIRGRFGTKRFIHVAWFGGEPLLEKSTIKRLSAQMLDFCAEIHAEYNASMTTNGYYLDPSFSGSLANYGIKLLQVTFDGDMTDHDRMRRLSNGRGSFGRLRENVEAFCELNPDCNLTLRVNCSDMNYERIPALLKRFSDTVRNKAVIFFRWLWPNEASGYKDFSECRRGETPFEGLDRLYRAAKELGWRALNPLNANRFGFCEVDFLDHYLISPDGRLFLCDHTFDSSVAIGSILEDPGGITPKVYPQYAKWYAQDPFRDEECLACQLLPVCNGGCRRARTKGTRQCVEEKGSMDLFVRQLVVEAGVDI